LNIKPFMILIETLWCSLGWYWYPYIKYEKTEVKEIITSSNLYQSSDGEVAVISYSSPGWKCLLRRCRWSENLVRRRPWQRLSDGWEFPFLMCTPGDSWIQQGWQTTILHTPFCFKIAAFGLPNSGLKFS
jgi:hypothetical protein